MRMSGNNGPKPPSKREAARRSEMLAGSTLHVIGRPNVIDENVTFASFHSLVPVKATNAAAFCCLYRLPVHDYHRGTRRPAGFRASFFIDFSLQASPHTGVLPHAEIVVHGAPGWKLPWKKTPLTAGAKQIENRVDHSTNMGNGNDSRQNGPFGLRGSNSPLLEVFVQLSAASVPPLFST